MPETNDKIAAVFEQMARVLEILEVDRFKIISFSRAARSLEQLAEDLAEIGPDEKKLMEIEGIGKGMAQRIAEFLKTGQIAEYNDLLSKIPAGLPELLEIPGLGPKTVALLWKQVGIDSRDALGQKLQDESLAELPGFGAKKLENLKKNFAFTAAAGKRFRINQALNMARWVIDKLREASREIQKIEYAGSLRRGKETIGDVDILVAAPAIATAKLMRVFTTLEPVQEVLGSGETKSSVRMESGIQVDLRVVTLDQFGAALLYFTGSKEHNVRMRERAIQRGLTLNEYGLFRRDDDVNPIASRTEQEIFEALGLAYIPPELREDSGEIAQAETGKLPALLEVSDIRAELHAHTRASDGRLTIHELAHLAIERGYHTLAVTDHSRSQVQAHGLSEERLLAHVEQVRRVAAELRGEIRLLAGSEVDILTDGSLDYPNSVLKELDFVVASPHAALTQDGKDATRRLLKAVSNPYVNVIGHPTGRLLTRREGLNPSFKSIFEAAAERGVAMEINASPFRLDLRDNHVRYALEMGVKISINTDAHDSADFSHLYYGVMTARRAGATPANVVNCMSRDDLAKWIASTRG